MNSKKKHVRSPVQSRSIERKENIIEAAYKLVKQRGYAETGIRDIVEAAGVSIGTFYSYYRDKNDIALEILRKYSEEFYGSLAGDTIDSLKGESDLSAILYEILLRMKNSALKNPKLHRELAILSLTDAKIAAAVKKIEKERIQTEASKLLQYFAGKVQLRSEPTSLLIAQRAMDDIISYMVLQGFDVDSETILRETALMISSYLLRI
ncbi:TetR/AcrR family transcriptional regulator [Leptospira stimsonii]|uniref:TetR/AcrR family transcriptional regulator n=1 Tax=Leptospira stimsonii TaxID=2202203 RepID=A0ABY2MUV9_9LEPT|nr:TetR/AcrR family transcriptional regulator [Leptospira stimsonii]TGK25325.1 TetR/AcrR family transcriptional regulator [Leptospira stimsonii]TGM08744.1 TetR/AcrR family transcriptional regulator [Leptospira stimsonii]